MRENLKQAVFPVVSILIFTTILLFLSIRELKNDANPHPVINEVCNNNFSCLNDGYGNYPSWIELYNPHNIPINLKQYGLSVSPGKMKWELPDTVLEPGAYLLLAEDIPSAAKEKSLSGGVDDLSIETFLSDGARANLKERVFFDFSISKSGDIVYLINASGDVCDTVTVPRLLYDTTYARVYDGADEWEERTPTPGYSNSGSLRKVMPTLEAPVFSRHSGFYEESFELEIKANNGEHICYTLDGSEPTVGAYEYTQPIRIYDESASPSLYASRPDLSAYTQLDVDSGKYEMQSKAVDKAVTVRAFVYDDHGNISPTATAVYFIGYGDRQEYSEVPVISLIADPDDLFGYDNGIYVLGKSYGDSLSSGEIEEEPEQVEANYKIRGRKSEREAYLNFFDEVHNEVFSQNVGIRIRGGYSRTNSQKSINIFSRNIYEGQGSFKGSFFDGVYPETSVSLFAGGQDAGYKYKDELFSRLMEGTDTSVLKSKPCYLFLNGEFWGIYWLQERYTDYYFRNHYYTKKDNTTNIKLDYHTEEGDLLDEKYQEIWNFIDSSDLSDEAVYEDFCSLVDIDSLIDYYAANIYIEHLNDWPRSNIGIWRSLSVEPGNSYEDGRWRYYIFDVNSTSMLDADNETLSEVLGYDALLRALFTNGDFRLKFLERFRTLEKRVFDVNRVEEILDELDSEMGIHLKTTWDRFHIDAWDEEKFVRYEQRIKDFFGDRREYIDGIIEHACLDYEDYIENVYNKR